MDYNEQIKNTKLTTQKWKKKYPIIGANLIAGKSLCCEKQLYLVDCERCKLPEVWDEL